MADQTPKPNTSANTTRSNTSESAVPQRQAIRFGEFLAALDVLAAEKLAGALKASKEIGIPMGRTLVVRGLLTNEDLGRLLEFHSLFRRGLVDFEQIRQAFIITKQRNCNVKEALEQMGCPVDEIESVRLGELLLAADLIDVDKLNNALSLQDLCGLPLGRVLCIHGGLPQEIVDAALECQTEIRQGGISYVEAVDKLKLMPLLMTPDTMRPTIKFDLRDLLVAGKVCTDGDLQPAINFAISNNLPLEKVLSSFDWIDPTLVSATLGLSKLIDSGYITAQEAVTFLSGTDLKRARQKADKTTGGSDGDDKMNLHKFLLACGFLSPDDIRDLTKIMVTRGTEFGSIVDAKISDSTPKDQLKELIIGCFANDNQLADVLVTMFNSDELVITHARNMVDLVAIGGISLEKALLSFASIRQDVARFQREGPLLKEE